MHENYILISVQKSLYIPIYITKVFLCYLRDKFRLISTLLPATHSCPSIKSAPSSNGLIKSGLSVTCETMKQKYWPAYKYNRTNILNRKHLETCMTWLQKWNSLPTTKKWHEDSFDTSHDRLPWCNKAFRQKIVYIT